MIKVSGAEQAVARPCGPGMSHHPALGEMVFFLLRFLFQSPSYRMHVLLPPLAQMNCSKHFLLSRQTEVLSVQVSGACDRDRGKGMKVLRVF